MKSKKWYIDVMDTPQTQPVQPVSPVQSNPPPIPTPAPVPINPVTVMPSVPKKGMSLWPVLIIALLAAYSIYASYSGMWPFAAKVAVSPTPDVTAGWKTYTNANLGFSIEYPESIMPTLELNDQYNRLTTFGASEANTTFEVRLQKDTDPKIGVAYGFLGSTVMSKNVPFGGVVGYEAVSATGYGDAGVQGLPYVEFGARKNGDVYHVIFYGDATMSEQENQILSTFKLTR